MSLPYGELLQGFFFTSRLDDSPYISHEATLNSSEAVTSDIPKFTDCAALNFHPRKIGFQNSCEAWIAIRTDQ